MDYVMEGIKQHGRGSRNGGLQLHNPSMNRPYTNDELGCSWQSGMNFNGNRSFLNPVNSSQLVYPNLALGVGTSICNNSSMLKEKARAIPNGRISPSLLSMTDAGHVESFSCEDSFIIQGKSLKYVVDKGCGCSKGQKKKSHNEIAMQNLQGKRQSTWSITIARNLCVSMSPRSYSPLVLQPTCSSLVKVQGYIYFMAKDQCACWFLQRIFDEGICQDVQIIFNEIIDHVVELMMNPFGNYLMPKLFEVCGCRFLDYFFPVEASPSVQHLLFN